MKDKTDEPKKKYFKGAIDGVLLSEYIWMLNFARETKKYMTNKERNKIKNVEMKLEKVSRNFYDLVGEYYKILKNTNYGIKRKI